MMENSFTSNYSGSYIYDHDDASISEDSEGESSLVDGEVQKETERDELREVQNFAKRETTHVRLWRLVVMLMIACTGAGVTTLTFMFLREEDKEDFETTYYSFASTIKDSAKFHINNLVLAFRNLGETITSTSLAEDSPFPFVSVPMFEVQGEHARLQSGIEIFCFSPLVTENTYYAWGNYSNTNQRWIAESRRVVLSGEEAYRISDYRGGPITPFIWQRDEDYGVVPSTGPFPFAPAWQTSPPPFDPTFINYNMFAEDYIARMFEVSKVFKEAVVSEVVDLTRLSVLAMNSIDHEAFHQNFVQDAGNSSSYEHPHSVLLQPIFRDLHANGAEIVGILLAVIPWDRYLVDLLPQGVNGIFVVLRNTCGQSFTYRVNGNTATYYGDGDHHEEQWSHMEIKIPLSDRYSESTENVAGHCSYYFSVYPSNEFHESTDSSLHYVFAAVVAATFFLMAATFLVYDIFVRRRNKKVINAAARSNAIVSSLFPSNVRDRLFEDAEKEEEEEEVLKEDMPFSEAPKSQLRSFLNAEETENEADDKDIMFKTKPIADLFPETTILFADIVGFTAWSSAREPTQVFTLLETLYKAFDEIAKRRRVFKVETVGDCYVAVSGLPDPRKDHAVVMARFARDCMYRMQVLTKKLEVTLGPDTADLSMRMGLHSGPVTAGVLRGERSRFQLFGDTMNTASRIESTGMRDRIHVSEETADLLASAGKVKWITPREEMVVAKGKGEMQTYWLECRKKRRSDGSTSGSEQYFDDDTTMNSELSGEGRITEVPCPPVSAKTSRLIDWNVEVLLRLLKNIVARRQASRRRRINDVPNENFVRRNGRTVLDEVKETIDIPEFDAKAAKNEADPEKIQLRPAVEGQMYEYVSTIASLYRENPFHSFEHASHVSMSVVKLLSRIVAPIDEVEHSEHSYNMHTMTNGQKKKTMASMLHDHTYGITSDPLTQFGCVFSALIHDVDHTGVPNTQLLKENPQMAAFYKGKSIAEQNSVDLAWELLMDDGYADLRGAIYTTDTELKHFREVVVNSVMATDIMDKDLKILRNQRWDRAFAAGQSEQDPRAVIKRKATIVIEHLIQASDVAHTMQHWHVYHKWNERLFMELYKAYKEGRSESNPVDFWYKGEIGFFDFYIIPLAKKLKDCGVFGVSSAEYLNYAMKNRDEWEARGQEVVSEMMEDLTGKELV